MGRRCRLGVSLGAFSMAERGRRTGFRFRAACPARPRQHFAVSNSASNVTLNGTRDFEQPSNSSVARRKRRFAAPKLHPPRHSSYEAM